MEAWDVVVIGAGPSGLMAACRAAERGRKTLLLEKNRMPGAKILLSGGTRCNLTHAADRRGIIEAFGSQGRFLHSALAAMGPDDVVDLFQAEGVTTKVEPGGKIFPTSDRAADVVAALVARLRRTEAALALGEPLQDLHFTPASEDRELRREQERPTGADGDASSGSSHGQSALPPRFRLVTAQRTLTAQSVILATGGKSYPASGSTGDGYAWAVALGHSLVPPRPALVPITTHAQWLRALQGITLPDVVVRIVEPGGDRSAAVRCLAQQRGALLLTHFGCSGPAVLDVSRAVSGHASPESLLLRCDFLPDMKPDALESLLQQECGAAGKRLASGILARWLPQRLAETLAERTGLGPDRRAAELTRQERHGLVMAAKQLDIPVAGTMGFRKAEVTAGGVSLAEVDSHTMQSRLVPGLYFAGELLDLDGPIGGYNFQAAFSTGWLAGENC